MKENLQKLQEFHTLFQQGIITQQEYEAKKRELLGLPEEIIEKPLAKETVTQKVPTPKVQYSSPPKQKTSGLNGNQIFLIAIGALLLLGGVFWYWKGNAEPVSQSLSDNDYLKLAEHFAKKYDTDVEPSLFAQLIKTQMQKTGQMEGVSNYREVIYGFDAELRKIDNNLFALVTSFGTASSNVCGVYEVNGTSFNEIDMNFALKDVFNIISNRGHNVLAFDSILKDKYEGKYIVTAKLYSDPGCCSSLVIALPNLDLVNGKISFSSGKFGISDHDSLENIQWKSF